MTAKCEIPLNGELPIVGQLVLSWPRLVVEFAIGLQKFFKIINKLQLSCLAVLLALSGC